MTAPVTRRVYVVLKSDGQLYEICAVEATADRMAERIGGTVEGWPVNRSTR